MTTRESHVVQAQRHVAKAEELSAEGYLEEAIKEHQEAAQLFLQAKEQSSDPESVASLDLIGRSHVRRAEELRTRLQQGTASVRPAKARPKPAVEAHPAALANLDNMSSSRMGLSQLGGKFSRDDLTAALFSLWKEWVTAEKDIFAKLSALSDIDDLMSMDPAHLADSIRDDKNSMAGSFFLVPSPSHAPAGITVSRNRAPSMPLLGQSNLSPIDSISDRVASTVISRTQSPHRVASPRKAPQQQQQTSRPGSVGGEPDSSMNRLENRPNSSSEEVAQLHSEIFRLLQTINALGTENANLLKDFESARNIRQAFHSMKNGVNGLRQTFERVAERIKTAIEKVRRMEAQVFSMPLLNGIERSKPNHVRSGSHPDSANSMADGGSNASAKEVELEMKVARLQDQVKKQDIMLKKYEKWRLELESRARKRRLDKTGGVMRDAKVQAETAARIVQPSRGLQDFRPRSAGPVTVMSTSTPSSSPAHVNQLSATKRTSLDPL
eukprot:GILK01000363.1.p1 GENE.GILK01000363.1~~GILK01000363.1.p1  ORF type:complete len:508 (-),score=86.94 GILK01000363.1:934-2421(-)